MDTIREKISKATSYYFKKASLSETFIELQKGGVFDTKTVIKVLGQVCDYLEEKEKEKK